MMGRDESKPLRWGILGCARISRRGLIPGIHDSRTGTLLTLASRDGTTARAWAQEFDVPKAAGSYEEVLADPEIDAVYIPLPNELHKPWVFAAADAGKHVLCEKPLALNAEEAREMAAHCRERGVILMEAFMWRQQPRSLALKQMVSEGAIGKLRLIRASFSFPIDVRDWRLDPARGGGALWDIGCYGVSAARFYTDAEPRSIRARAHFWETGVDMTLVAALEFPGEIVAAIDCSFEQPSRCFVELVGTEGVIEVPDAFINPPQGPPRATVRTIRPGTVVQDEDYQTRELTFEPTNHYASMVDAFAEAVARGSLLPPAENGVAQMETIDAILAAAKAR
jgi:predicted dehydrogenase